MSICLLSKRKKDWKSLVVYQIYSKGSVLTSIMPTLNYFYMEIVKGFSCLYWLSAEITQASSS